MPAPSADLPADRVGEHRSIGEEEVERESSLLLQILELFPVTLTIEELVQTRLPDPSDASTIEGWKRAVRELRAHGLVRLDDKTIVPTLAAVHAYELLDR